MNFDFKKDILDWSAKAISQLGFVPARKSDASSRLAEVFEILRNRIPPTPQTIRISRNFRAL